MESKETFHYTYNAAQQQEIEQIRQTYLPTQESKLDRLRKLHRSATQKAQSWALTLGILGALIMGTGMSLAMTNLGTGLGDLAMILGIIVGFTGMIALALAYPVYQKVLQKERTRIAPEILRLSDELTK